MKKSLRLCAALLLVAAGLNAQAVRPPRAQPPTYAWAGMQLGRFGDEMLGIEFSLSAQVGKGGYGSLYYFGASVPFSAGDQVSEYGIMAGLCTRGRGAFAGVAAGLGVLKGWLGSSEEVTVFGVPFKMEAALTLNSFMAINLQARAFICKRTYSGISLGLQLGKMR